MSRLFSRVLPIALVALAACGPAAVGNYFVPTAAVVNGKAVPESKIAQQLQKAIEGSPQQFKGPAGAANRSDAQRQILNQLLRQEVINQEAAKSGFRVTPKEIHEQIMQLKSGNFKSEAEFNAALKKEGFTLAELREFLRDRELSRKVAARVTKGSEPTDEDLRAFYEENKAQFDQVAKAAHVLICASFDPAAPNCTPTPDDEKIAADVSKRAKAGEDFAALAKQYSVHAATKEKGGDLGFFQRGQMPPEFEQAAFALNPGEVSVPVKTQFGLHVIKLLAKGKTFEEAKEEIQQNLGEQFLQQAFQKWLEDALRRSRVKVNPKFGRFDQTTLTIVQREIEIESQQAGQRDQLPVGGGGRTEGGAP